MEILTTNKKATICRAKNPKTCPHHGLPTTNYNTVAEAVRKQIEAQKEQTFLTTSTEPNMAPFEASTASELVHHAITNSLKWVGEKPSWWEEYVKNSKQGRTKSTAPEILDMLQTPEGPAYVIWNELCSNKQENMLRLTTGFNTSDIVLLSKETGDKLAFVNITNVNSESFKDAFGDDEFTNFRWVSRFQGTALNLKNYGADAIKKGHWKGYNLTEEEKVAFRKELWLNWHRKTGGYKTKEGKHIAKFQLETEHIPDDLTVIQDLKKASQSLQSKIDDHKKYFAVPYIDYSSVESDKLQGKGYGASLYVYAARRLAQQGQCLRGSQVQSGSASKLWKKFKKKMPSYVKSFKYTNLDAKTETFYALDFRSQK